MIRSTSKSRASFYPAQPPDIQIALDHPPPSFSRDVASSEQECELNYMLYGAVPRDFSNGEDVLHQDRTIPPLTGHPVILAEYDQHFPSHLAQTSAIAPAPGIHGTRDVHRFSAELPATTLIAFPVCSRHTIPS
ncbi:hypothetical protein BKA82DRAFT_336153 [Pisolithus tinctorius]|uniref:Uncharacterized protein n=1 Tax=Pisolithus tinctorius Marx 270 TaxID=870435 RepID=A0A0C3ID18_PISTI|nr:hypothetical protein BKA82DRAFT_336153 [Pisolithus tinctorius]KIN94927.1 hypothetical protein M404DRAFT_336153 [Pisolithus tinctorius Marx 270]